MTPSRDGLPLPTPPAGLAATGTRPAVRLHPTPARPPAVDTPPAAAAPWFAAGVVLTLLLGAALGLWHLVAPPRPAPPPLAALALLVVTAGAGIAAAHTAVDRSLDPALRRGWTGIALGVLCLWTAALLRIAQLARGGDHGAGTLDVLADGVQLLAAPLWVIALGCWPQAPRARHDRLKYALDVAIVVAAGTLVAWYDVTVRGVPAGASGAAWRIHAAIAGDLVALLTVSLLWQRTVGRAGWRGLGRGMPRALALLGAALGAAFLADVGRITLLHVGPQATVDWPRVLQPLVLAFVAAAAWRQHREQAGAIAPPPRPTARTLAATSAVPFIVALPAFAVLLLSVTELTEGPVVGIAIGIAALAALAFLRVAVATRETLDLLSRTAAQESEARFRALVQHASDLILILDPDTTIRWSSPSLARLFGHRPEGLHGRRLAEFVHVEDRDIAESFLHALSTAPTAGGDDGPPPQCEWRMADAGGRWHTLDHVGTNLLAEPTVQGLVLTARDVTERRVIEEQYMHQAFHDPLTDLANRALFLYQVGHALARGARHGHPVAVLFLDLDSFKEVNDSLGHAAGDRLLVEAGRRLGACVRGADLIARLGGDEFAVLVEGAERDDEVIAMADRIVEAIGAPFRVQGTEVRVSASVGIARARPGDGTDELVRNADVAMYLAKTRGKGRWELFAPHMQHAALERLELEADLRRAIDREELWLEFQPIVDLRTGALDGAEALVRWHRSEKGMVPPAVFIPIAEATGLILPISRWVLAQVARQAAAWRRELGRPLRVMVNLSGHHLADDAIVDDVRVALEGADLPAGTLVLELPEAALAGDAGRAGERLARLRALGAAIAIDDFGTGVASLASLQRFPIDVLKIDRAFVDAIGDGPDGAALARAIVALADSLGLETIAEGVETEAQRGALVALGCPRAQGYLFSAPVTPEALVRLAATRGVVRAAGPGALESVA